jgi:hypothetical protein
MVWKIAKPPARAAFRLLSRACLTLSRRDYRYVFILGHMRSGSTLLAHILASHPDFVGAGEMHVQYDSTADLPKLVLKTCEFLHRPFLHEAYIVDQINHDLVTDEVLRSDKVEKCIILMREPEATLKSMLTLKSLNLRTEKDAMNIYMKRLGVLAAYGLVLKRRAWLVEYDDLVGRTEETLAGITNFLGVNPPFEPMYNTRRTTRRVGDPSSNILRGRVARTPGHAHPVSDEALSEMRHAFLTCRRQLLGAASTNRLAKSDLTVSGHPEQGDRCQPA